MNDRKKLNLIPAEVREKYTNRYMFISFCAAIAIFIAVLVFQYARIGVISYTIDKIHSGNERYNEEKIKIDRLQSEIDAQNAFLGIYENDTMFPFSQFMHDMEANRPDSVKVISVDTDDRLIDEGVQDEDEEKDKKDNKKDEDKKAEDESEADTEDAEVVPEIKYSADISGQTITLRGYGSSQEDIAQFIYNLSELSYISGALVTGIEEHKMADGLEYNIFELKFVGGVRE